MNLFQQEENLEERRNNWLNCWVYLLRQYTVTNKVGEQFHHILNDRFSFFSATSAVENRP
jgi:hypothetical protein